MATDPQADAVLLYWFGPNYTKDSRYYLDHGEMKKWFSGGPAVDQEIREKFGSLLADVGAGKYDHWLEHPVNGLAGVIVMDQLSRNIYRGDAQTYALDTKALAWAKHLLDTRKCADMAMIHQNFLNLPLMHSEVVEDQQRCVEECKKLKEAVNEYISSTGDTSAEPLAKFFANVEDFAVRHLNIVEKYGRFPHRNTILGRESTPEEVAGLADGSIERF